MARRKKRSFFEQCRVDSQNFYDEYNTTQIKLKLNNKTDKDILDWLHKQLYSRDSSMQGAIKKLIRQELNKDD